MIIDSQCWKVNADEPAGKKIAIVGNKPGVTSQRNNKDLEI